MIFAKCRQYTLQIPCGSKICHNHSVSHRLPDKCAFALYAEIQDGCHKWWESDFLQKVASRLCRYHVGQKFCRNCSISHFFRDKCTFAFYTEIQDGCQKWRESSFCSMLPFRGNCSISHRFQEKCFYILRRNSRWPPKVAGKRFL